MPIAAIIAETRTRYWHLPRHAAARASTAKRQYMRRYMREVYRPAHKSRSVALSPQEDACLREAAGRYGRRPATLLREAAFAYLEQRSLLPKSLEAGIAALTLEVRRIGTNINQLAHQANLRPETAASCLRQAVRLLSRLESAPAACLPGSPPPPAHGDQVADPA
jgi:hypothetical protein